MDIKSLSKDKIEKIIEIFLKKSKRSTEIQELEELPCENKGLYSLTTKDNEKYVICIYGINEQTQQAVYWMDRFTYYGKIQEVFSDDYLTVIVYSRGEKYQNEYIVKHYNQTSGYPMTELITENEYPERVDTLKQVFMKVN
jgi:predicted type IV restriction endonuclease